MLAVRAGGVKRSAGGKKSKVLLQHFFSRWRGVFTKLEYLILNQLNGLPRARSLEKLMGLYNPNSSHANSSKAKLRRPLSTE
jgi:hypothetical protein